MEYVTVKMPMYAFNLIMASSEDTSLYEVKLIEEKDDLFINDEIHKELKKKSDKAFKELKEYEFKKRHNIK